MDVVALFTGAFGATFVTVIGQIVIKMIDRHDAKKNKKDTKDDEQSKAIAEIKQLCEENGKEIKDLAAKLNETEKKVGSVSDRLEGFSDSLKVILWDRIQHFGQKYIEQGFCPFDEKRILRLQHSQYHNVHHGNGDLDEIMKRVEGLPYEPPKDQKQA